MWQAELAAAQQHLVSSFSRPCFSLHIFYNYGHWGHIVYNYTLKKDYRFPVLSRDVTYQTLPGREKLKYSHPERVW
jgi:hypothetical protein